MNSDLVLGFITVQLAISFTPGPAVAIVTAFALRQGFAAALGATAGIVGGNLVWFALSALGFGALAKAFPAAVTALTIAGAIYLVWLGLQAWRNAGAGSPPDAPVQAAGNAFTRAALTQLANPKALLFFAALLPQFVDAGRPLVPQYGVLIAINAVSDFLAHGLYGALAARGRSSATTAMRLLLERISAVLLAGVGIIVLASRVV